MTEAPTCVQLLARIVVVEAGLTALRDLLNERNTAISERFQASKEATALALSALRDTTATTAVAAERAATKAEGVAEKRQDASNEIRAAMIDQQRHFADKELTEQKFTELSRRLDDMQKIVSASGGQSTGIGMVITGGIAVFAALGAIGALLIHH